MNTELKVYSADEVTLSIFGQLIDSGFAEGEFVSVEMQAQDFTSKVGADGQVARSKTNDRRATMKVKLMQTSLGNNILSAQRALDIGGTNGAGVGLFEIRDRSSGVLLAHAPKSWIAKAPAVSRGREVGEYEWTLEAAHMTLDVSGNPSV